MDKKGFIIIWNKWYFIVIGLIFLFILGQYIYNSYDIDFNSEALKNNFNFKNKTFEENHTQIYLKEVKDNLSLLNSQYEELNCSGIVAKEIYNNCNNLYSQISNLTDIHNSILNGSFVSNKSETADLEENQRDDEIFSITKVKNIIRINETPKSKDFMYGFYEEEINTTLIENYIFDMTNEIRTDKGISPLKRNKELDSLAQYHSKNMVMHNFYDHVDHEGLDPTERAEKLKIRAWVDKGSYLSGIAENIAKTPWYSDVIGCGDTTHNLEIAECIVDGWKNSPGHYENIIGNYNEIGVGVYFDSDNNVFSTQNFR